MTHHDNSCDLRYSETDMVIFYDVNSIDKDGNVVLGEQIGVDIGTSATTEVFCRTHNEVVTPENSPLGNHWETR